ncbi:hypothetical protein HanPSC8_Chr12g0524591 [Helianthus annuus]|nr:hypothetical protein HanPSC8_Chr12g0524591 [Helianthus annuus]
MRFNLPNRSTGQTEPTLQSCNDSLLCVFMTPRFFFFFFFCGNLFRINYNLV